MTGLCVGMTHSTPLPVRLELTNSSQADSPLLELLAGNTVMADGGGPGGPLPL